MNSDSADAKLISKLPIIAQRIAIVVTVMGLFALVGWLLNITEYSLFLYTLVSICALAAITFCLGYSIHATKVERTKLLDALSNTHRVLELKVAERTSELREANQVLEQ